MHGLIFKTSSSSWKDQPDSTIDDEILFGVFVLFLRLELLFVLLFIVY